jgi:NhaP-type Na+/H+ and K+/H+ antiporter
MSQAVSVAIIALKSVILLLGGGIAYIAYKAHRRTKSPSLRALALGFGVVTVGALLAGIAQQVFDVSLQAGVLINSLLTALGFGIIIYSLYIER